MVAPGQVLGQPDALLPRQVGALSPHDAVLERCDDRPRGKRSEEHGSGCALPARRGVTTGAGLLEQFLGLETRTSSVLGAGGDQGCPGDQTGRGECRESRLPHEASPEDLSLASSFVYRPGILP